MSRDSWARLVETVVRREQIRQLFLSHSRSPSISTIGSSEDDHLNDSFNGQITNDSLRTLSVSRIRSPRRPPPPPLSVRNPSVSKVSNDATLPFPRKLFSAWYRRMKPKNNIPEIEHFRRFSLGELQVATDNFSPENVLSYGYHRVYRGRLADGTLVAVKIYRRERSQEAEKQFRQEVRVISMTGHSNLLGLIGFCITSKDRRLVYPLMVNGSVASNLRERPKSRPSLDWPIRKRIALGSAKGLAYLHDECDLKIVHRDVKAASILLDEDFEAVIAEFDLAKLMDHNDNYVTTTVRGRVGHVAPEYLGTGRCSEKIDVFGYGIFLLELITGQRAFDLTRLADDDDMMLLDWVKTLMVEKKWEMIFDANCEGDHLMLAEVEQLIQLALLCAQTDPEARPKMSEIVRMLEGGDGLAERWEQLQKVEVFNQEVDHISSSIITFDAATLNVLQDELPGP